MPTTQTGHNLEATVSGEESLRNHTTCQHNNPTDVSNKLPAAFPNITVVRHRSGPGQKPSRTILYFSRCTAITVYWKWKALTATNKFWTSEDSGKVTMVTGRVKNPQFILRYIRAFTSLIPFINQKPPFSE